MCPLNLEAVFFSVDKNNTYICSWSLVQPCQDSKLMAMILKTVPTLNNGSLWFLVLVFFGLVIVVASRLHSQARDRGATCSLLSGTGTVLLKSCHFSRQPASHVQAGHEALGKTHMCDFHWKRGGRELHCIHLSALWVSRTRECVK